MQWIKKGLIYCANGENSWTLSHAALPTPYKINDHVLRIYCAFRAEKNVSRIGYVDVMADNPQKIIKISQSPVLDIGETGTFDDNGVVPHSICTYEDKIYLYYTGFQLGTKTPYTMFNGLAVSNDGGDSFIRHQRTPITDRSDSELFFRTAAHVLRDENTWHMWYVAGGRWTEYNGKLLPYYSMKYLSSHNGISWGEKGYSCFEPQGDEYGFGRPYVVYEEDIYKMYYSIRSHSKKYQLGYAESQDGKKWLRKDEEMKFDPRLDMLDSEMMCYSAIVTHNGKTYLFYNGNNHGGTGILYAELNKC